jgi:alcohol dehydrogenase (cytochrome c)
VSDAAGWIRAFNAKDGSPKWQYKSALPVVAGVTPTAGGVVLSGELTGDFIVLDAADGKVLYRYYTGGPIGGGVSTYEIDGRQYVVVASGNESRTWSPDNQPSATMFIFALPEPRAGVAQ